MIAYIVWRQLIFPIGSFNCRPSLHRVVRVNMRISAMEAQTQILKVEKDGEDGLIVTFSDGTTAGYVVEELLGLRPFRERVEEPLKSDRPTTIVTKIRFSVGAPYST